MNTIDEQGNVIAESPESPAAQYSAFAPVLRHVNLLQQLGGLHSQIMGTPVTKRTVVTAFAVAAGIGAMWWLKSLNEAIDAESDDDEQL